MPADHTTWDVLLNFKGLDRATAVVCRMTRDQFTQLQNLWHSAAPDYMPVAAPSEVVNHSKLPNAIATEVSFRRLSDKETDQVFGDSPTATHEALGRLGVKQLADFNEVLVRSGFPDEQEHPEDTATALPESEGDRLLREIRSIPKINPRGRRS